MDRKLGVCGPKLVSLAFWHAMAVKRLLRGLLALNLASVAGASCPAVCTATSDNAAWPCRYHANGCQVSVAANPARAGAADVNVAVLSPYSGGLGELMTMVEPAIAMATQDVESSNLLPGFRMNVFLGDSKCSVPSATQATVEACASGPTKHALLADSCSAACEAINDAAQFFNVLQAGSLGMAGIGETKFDVPRKKALKPYMQRLQQACSRSCATG